jgi:exopolysaccharide transport family protein
MTIQKPILPAGQAFPVADTAPDFSEQARAPALDLVVLLRILRVRRQIILGTAAAVITLVLLVLFQIKPLYTASSIVMLDGQKSSVEDLTNALSGLRTDPAGVQNQVQILTSRALAERVIDKLDLADTPEFQGGKGGWKKYMGWISPISWLQGKGQTQIDTVAQDRKRDDLVNLFEKRLTVTPIGNSTAIKVSFASQDAAQAARIDNAIADAYVEDQLNAKFEATQKATHWLADRIQELSKQSQEAEAAVQAYRAANGMTETANGGSVVDQQMADISGQLVNARSDLAIKEATYSHVASLARQGRAADISQATSSPLISSLRNQEADLIRQEADLSSKYGARNPKMLELESQKANLEAKIGEEVGRVVQSVKNDVDIAAAHVASLEGSLHRSEGQSTQQNQLKVKLAALQSAATSAKTMYESFLAKFNQSQDQQGIQTPDARIISRADVPRTASYPDRLLVTGIAIPSGLLLGLIFAFLMERLDSGFRTSYQIEKMLNLPVLATVPEIQGMAKGKNTRAADRIIDKPMSSYAESIRGLNLSLTLANIDRKPKVVVVTSAVPNEGKTTISVSLGRIAAQSGLKVLIIDGDLRRPAVASTMGLESRSGGLVEALLGTHPLDQCLVKDPMSDAVILPCGTKPKNPSDMLGSQAFRALLENFTSVFDLVVIDSAPVLPVNDTKILSQLADSVLFVVRWEKTPREGAANAVRALNDVHAPVAGIALARADMARFQQYSYGYQDYYYYNKYYTD